MRCVICDASDVGLSNYRPDGYYHSRSFHIGSDDKVYCSECDSEYSDLMSDYHEDDLENDDGAFETI